jgi:glycosyltransferase involved in cell wall biosynthesis
VSLGTVYAMADALVFPSLVEGFGLPILEAMAAGTPVIASDASVMPEVAGDAALYFAPDDPSALAAHLHALASQPELAARLRAAGLARATTFSWDRAARATLDLYRTVADGS